MHTAQYMRGHRADGGCCWIHKAVIRPTAADTGLMTFWGLLAFWQPSLQCIHTFLFTFIFWVRSFLPNVYSFPCASFTVNIITVHIYTYTKLSLCSPNIYQHKKHHILAIQGQQIALFYTKTFFLMILLHNYASAFIWTIPSAERKEEARKIVPCLAVLL